MPFDLAKGDKSKLKATLAECFPPDTAKWLLAEMQQNRDRVVVKTKVGPRAHFHHVADRPKKVVPTALPDLLHTSTARSI